ncbi:membrane dipeptidase [Actinosynnema sp. ALI-1.44]|uniref:dipeptidase n=1 Tax=Actinosynnema sp. ALI-1.44 TaxID=1933779 RepID=UPI00097BC229|nr:dipeptidase [Actinosynnema sp. ALI-1.44]ONI79424.1 membrane dipeptidase [Actinosynnema sp. ALI-1.44]
MKSAGFDRAVALLRTTQLADGHNDLPWALRLIGGPDPATAVGSTDLTVAQPGLHTDIPRLRQGGVGLQFWSVYVPCQFEGHSAVTAVLEQIEVVYRLAERYPAELAIARTADEAEEAFRSGKIASMLGAEGGHCIAESLGVLTALRRLGVRYMTLTHNLNTPWADSATDDEVHGGLTDFGRDVVREMNRIGMMVDLSHVAPVTMRAAIETSQAPVIFTHSSCRAVNDHVRNVPDDVLGSLKANGGVCMITFVPSFVSPSLREWDESVQSGMAAEGLDYRDLDARTKFVETWNGPAEPKATLDEVVTHLDHAREVAGIDHIGLGGDYDGVTSLPEGLEDVSKYPALLGALLDRGWSEEDCAKLAGRNAMRVLRATEEAAERQF